MSKHNHILRNIKKAALTTAGGVLISASVAAQSNDRKYIESTTTNNNTIVIDNYLTSDPFKHVGNQNTDLRFRLKNSKDTGIQYKVISYSDFIERAKNSIQNQVYNEAGTLGKIVCKIWTGLGYDLKESTVDGNLLKYIESTPYHKLSIGDGSIAELVNKSLNNYDKIKENGKQVDAKAIITPIEYSNIITEMRRLGYDKIIVPVDVSTSTETVPVLLLIEDNLPYKNEPKKEQQKKPEKKVIKKDPKEINTDSLANVVEQTRLNGIQNSNDISETRQEVDMIREDQKNYAAKTTLDSLMTANNAEHAKLQDQIDSLKAKSHEHIADDKTSRKTFQAYVGGGAEWNDYFNGLIPQVNAGVKIGRISFGGLFGYADNFRNQHTDKLFENIPTSYFDEATGKEVVFGGTEITRLASDNIKYKILQPGIEVGFDVTNPDKPVVLRFKLGAQYNIVKQNIKRDTTGTVYQWTTDDAGNRSDIMIPLEQITANEKFKDKYITLNPSMELKTNFRAPINLSLYGGAKFPINSKYGSKPMVNVGAILYFGNARGSRR